MSVQLLHHLRVLFRSAQRDSVDRDLRPSGLLSMWSATPLQTEAAVDVVTAPPPADADVRCVLALGAALLGYGLPAHRVEESVMRLLRALHLSGSVFGLPTALLITLRGSHGIDSHMVRAEPGTIDLARLDALHHLVACVERGELDVVQAERRVRQILEAPRRLPRWVDLVAVALVAFGGTLMLGGNARDAAWSSALGLGTAALLWISATCPAFSRVVPVAGAVLITLSSCLLAHAGTLDHPLVVAFAALFVLLPGLTLTLAMTELATGHLVSGTARSMGALAVFLQLGFGVLLGIRLGRLDQAGVSWLPPAPIEQASLGALLLAVGFAVLFAIRLRDTVRTLGICAVAFFSCRVAGAWLGVEIGVLLAASVVGLCSNAFARSKDRPASTLMLPGVVMLVPGSLGLMSVSAAAMHDPSRALDTGFQMIMVVIALSTGILLSAAAFPARSDL